MRNHLHAITLTLSLAIVPQLRSQEPAEESLPQARTSPPPAARQSAPPAGQPGATGQPNSNQPQGTSSQAPNPQLYRQQVSYALGRNFAQNLKEAEIDLDFQALVAGINDVLTSAKPKWTDEQLQTVLEWFDGEMQRKTTARMERDGAKNAQEASAFLAENGKREGVQTTPSGLQYRVLRQGTGPSPMMGDKVRCNYRGTLLNGTEFDSSTRHGGPQEFQIAPGLIKGWIEALQKMRVGDKWQIFVPPKLAYELTPPGPPIEANSMLVFEIELLDVVQRQ